MAGQRNACFPNQPSLLALAVAAQKAYAQTIVDWQSWLVKRPAAGAGRTMPSNAELLTLYKLIKETIDRRGPTGIWTDIDPNVVPTADQLKGVLDPSYTTFGNAVEAARAPVEQAALALGTILKSADLITEFEALPFDSQLTYLSSLADQLSASNVGMLFLRQSVGLDQTPLPLIHPDRITAKQGKFLDTDQPVLRRAAKIYAHACLKVLPALLKDESYPKLAALAVDFVGRYFPDDIVIDALALQEGLDDAKAWMVSHPDQWAEFGEQTAGWVQVTFDLINFGVAAGKEWRDPSLQSLYSGLKAFSSLSSAGLTVWKNYKGGAGFLATDAGKLVKFGLSEFNAVADVVAACVATYDSLESLRTGDLSVAAGNALQGVGLATTAVVSGVAAYSEFATVAALTAAVPGLQIIALVALVAVLVGIALTTYTKDSPFESWLQNCWFGNRWESVELEESPASMQFRYKMPNGVSIGRQVSGYLSILLPLNAAATLVGTAPQLVEIDLTPVVAYPESEFDLWHIVDNGILGDPQFDRYQRFRAWQHPWLLGQADSASVLPVLVGAPPNQTVAQWRGRFGSSAWSGGASSPVNMADEWIEIEVTIPAQFDAQVTQAVGGNDAAQDVSFPYTLRTRLKVAKP